MDNLENEESLACEALVREINRATRWTAVLGAWQALLNVRRMAAAMHKEAELFEGRGAQTIPTRPSDV